MSRLCPGAPPDAVIEAWPGLYTRGLHWPGEESKRLFDAAGEPVALQPSLPAGAVAGYHGPSLTDLHSLPPEDSLEAWVLSAHGVAAAWITLDRFGQRVWHAPASPDDPVFLRRRGGAGHLRRLFRAEDFQALPRRDRAP